MEEITYKAKRETRYKLDGEWWTIPDIDKLVTFENLEYGGFMYGVILNLVDGNEWRVINERWAKALEPVETEVEPQSISVIVKLPDNAPSNGIYPLDFLRNLCERMDYEGALQMNEANWVGHTDAKMVEFKISKGSIPIQRVLTLASKAIVKANAEVIAVCSPAGMIIYSNEITRLDVDYRIVG